MDAISADSSDVGPMTKEQLKAAAIGVGLGAVASVGGLALFGASAELTGTPVYFNGVPANEHARAERKMLAAHNAEPSAREPATLPPPVTEADEALQQMAARARQQELANQQAALNDEVAAAKRDRRAPDVGCIKVDGKLDRRACRHLGASKP